MKSLILAALFITCVTPLVAQSLTPADKKDIANLVAEAVNPRWKQVLQDHLTTCHQSDNYLQVYVTSSNGSGFSGSGGTASADDADLLTDYSAKRLRNKAEDLLRQAADLQKQAAQREACSKSEAAIRELIKNGLEAR